MTDVKIPERIGRLPELAGSLWWSWHPVGRAVFRTLDYPLWRLSGHNPVRQLFDISSDKLETAAADPAFLSLYDTAVTAFDTELKGGHSWYSSTHSGSLPGPVAYFSMEFALHNSLPIYAGGLGVLAGDLLKEASDLGIPMIAVGFMYPQGYFHQRISADGWQEEAYQQLDFLRAPAIPIISREGNKCLTEVRLKDRNLHVGAWLVKVGRVSLYLLDTSLEENLPQDRLLSNRLYTADREQRLQQEILLGIGGVRVLRYLGIQPAVWHANEGHTAFMMVERLREEISKGVSLPESLENVKRSSVFTTHTPVPAGHDVFANQLVEQYFESYWSSLKMDRNAFMDLGRYTGSNDGGFNMTILSLKTSGQSNAVSHLHGIVSRRMWYGLWPDCNENTCPISYVTNGVHVPTWISIEFRELYEKYLGKIWLDRQDDFEIWKYVEEIPDDELWRTHQILKRKLFHIILERAQQRWAIGETTPQQILAMGSLLDHDALTIAFVRRFAEYKRPSLLFYDVERLKRIINDSFRPVQIIFAGKSHPADTASKMLLQRVHTTARDHAFQGRIAFLEDYDMRLARYLSQGVDIWLNTPRRLQEASGTSGMKACLNGVIHLSVPDGWWHEAYQKDNGWSIGDDSTKANAEEEDRADADALYRLLEEKVIPLYYKRDRKGIPQDWVNMMKRSISTISPRFSARRMVKEYCERMYLPLFKNTK